MRALLLVTLVAVSIACGGRDAPPVDAADARTFLQRQFGEAPWFPLIESLTYRGNVLVVVADVSRADAQRICAALTFHEFQPDRVRVDRPDGEVLAERGDKQAPCTG